MLRPRFLREPPAMGSGNNIGVHFRDKPHFKFNTPLTSKLRCLQINPIPLLDAKSCRCFRTNFKIRVGR
ncbi:hypothetical protein ES708_25040 [subsurface metagenome]